jgi:hypothetical protein
VEVLAGVLELLGAVEVLVLVAVEVLVEAADLMAGVAAAVVDLMPLR